MNFKSKAGILKGVGLVVAGAMLLQTGGCAVTDFLKQILSTLTGGAV